MSENENNIGGRVGLDTTDFKAGISDLNRQIRVIDSGFKAAAAGLVDWGKSAEGLEGKMEALNKITDLQRKKIEGLTDVYKKIVAEKGEDSKAAQDLVILINKETELLNKNTLQIQKSSEALDKMKDTTQSLGDKISILDKEIEVSNSAFKASSSSMDSWKDSADGLNLKFDNLNSVINLQTNKISALKDEYKKVANEMGSSSNEARDLEIKINKETESLNKNQKELKDVTDTLDNFGKEVVDATEKTKKFDGALGDSLKGLGKIGGVVGKAAIVGVKAIGIAAIGAAVGAVKLALDVGGAADNLITLSNQTGISTKQLQEMEYAARFVDVPLETMTGSMAKVVKAMSGATDETKGTGAAFAALGVKIRDDVTGELRNNKDVWEESIDALGNIANETERDALAMEIFGKSAQELNPLIKVGSEELARLAEEANNVGAVMSDEAVEAAGKLDDVMQALQASSKGLASTLGVAAIPAITGIVNTITGVIPLITAAVKTGDWTGAGQAITEGINGILGQVIDLLPGLALMASTVIGGIATALVTAIPEVLPSLIDAALQLLDMIIQTLSENGPMLVTAGLDALMKIIEGIVEALPQLIEVAIDLLMTLINGIINNLPKLVDAAIKIMLALSQGLLDLLPELIPAAIQAILVLSQGLIDALPKLIERLPEIIETIVTVLIDNLPLLVDVSIKIIIALVTAIIQNLPLIIEAAIKIIGALAKGILGAVGSLIGVVPELFTSMKEAFDNIDWAELGVNLIAGITEGVKNAAVNLADGVKQAVEGALKAAKDLLGINSPSTVMSAQVGKIMGAGMAVGIKDSSKEVNAAMKGLNNKIISENNEGFKVNKYSGNNAPSGDIYVNVPLQMDGQIITKATSKIQYGQNKSRSRALGVMPA